MVGNSKQEGRRQAPAALADVALLDVEDVAAAVRRSRSWVLAEVREGRFPKPLRLTGRCTRWTSAAIREYIAQAVASASEESPDAVAVAAIARKASAAAVAARRARAAGAVQAQANAKAGAS